MAKIEMKRVSSSNIEAVGYDDESETLRVSFVNGTTYEYRDVPLLVASGLRTALSPGAFFAKHIKHLPCTVVDDDDVAHDPEGWW